MKLISAQKFEQKKIIEELNLEKEVDSNNYGATIEIKPEHNLVDKFFTGIKKIVGKTVIKEKEKNWEIKRNIVKDDITEEKEKKRDNNELINMHNEKDPFGIKELKKIDDKNGNEKIRNIGATVTVRPEMVDKFSFMQESPEGIQIDIETYNRNTDLFVKYLKHFVKPFISQKDVPDLKDSLEKEKGNYMLWLTRDDKKLKALIVSKTGDIVEVDFLIDITKNTCDLSKITKTLKRRMESAGYKHFENEDNNVIVQAIKQYKDNKIKKMRDDQSKKI